jgi:hypothetical protein
MDDQQDLERQDEPLEGVESPLKRIFPIIVVGIAMLLVGIALGYIGRGTYGPEAIAAKATSSAVAVAIQTRAATNKEVMTMIIGETRHFKGDANAPVTIIEFSDFQ